MLTRCTVNNFKSFHDADIDLGEAVVFIGPNNSGKTTALQALALWDLGLRRWNEKRGGREAPEKRPGVTINRRDLIALPVPEANLLWRDRRVRQGSREHGKTKTSNVLIEIMVEGITDDIPWQCGFEFDYANEESFYCRPMKRADGSRLPVPDAAATARMALLPPIVGEQVNARGIAPRARV